MVTGVYFLEYAPTGSFEPVVCLDQLFQEIPIWGIQVFADREISHFEYDSNFVVGPLLVVFRTGGSDQRFPCLGHWAFDNRNQLNTWVSLMRAGKACEAQARFANKLLDV